MTFRDLKDKANNTFRIDPVECRLGFKPRNTVQFEFKYRIFFFKWPTQTHSHTMKTKRYRYINVGDGYTHWEGTTWHRNTQILYKQHIKNTELTKNAKIPSCCLSPSPPPVEECISSCCLFTLWINPCRNKNEQIIPPLMTEGVWLNLLFLINHFEQINLNAKSFF